ncbi:uncharacterized protein MKZ38_001854 [Zalerion maritima]|uniref:DUF6594 domain-containing protein n=1 Tax=Zalerion maritima TaxID=339359 RepID=A0AAD5RQQ4_9PEZI|nr:uncharacterized protein MKZ38_001854 [Zalerion maritima]
MSLCTDEAIHRYSEIDRLTYPAEQHRKLVFDWIHGASLGGQCEFLGRDLANHPYKSVFHQDHVDDLIFLGNVVEENDAFSRFLLDRGLRWFHWGWRHVKASKLVFFAAAASAAICDIDTTAAAIKPVNRNEEDGYRHEDSDSKTALWHYEESSLRSAVRVIGMGLSPMPPLCGIITLFFVENLRARVFIVCGFTLMFSLCLAAVTRARRIEVFAATAAWGDTRFASVMVVFVGQIDDPNEEWKQWVEEIRDSVKAMGG